jgi:hypothetical protein
VVERRGFLKGSVLGAAGLALPAMAGCSPTPPLDTTGVFTHGVASGDPHADSVVLWTRVQVPPTAEPVQVRWSIGTEPTVAGPVASGTTTTDAARDGTVKVVAGGLTGSTTYYYRFDVAGAASPIGRTRTAPSGDADRLRFGVASCSNYGYGNFHAYRHLLRRNDLDAVIHLGDYIYEYASPGFGETYGEARNLIPRHEIVSLDDYRARYGHYRADPDLQELHRQHPMIHVWDDHEFADDPFVGGAANHQPSNGDWSARSRPRCRRTPSGCRPASTATASSGPSSTARSPASSASTASGGSCGQSRPMPASTWVVSRRRGSTRGSPRPTVVGWSRAADDVRADGAEPRRRRLDRGRPGGCWAPSPPRRRTWWCSPATSTASTPSTSSTIRPPTTRRRARSAAVEFAAARPAPGSPAVGVGRSMRWNTGFTCGYAVVDLTPERVECDFYGFADIAKLLGFLPDERWLAGFGAAHGAPTLVGRNRALGPNARPPLAATG